MATLKNAGATNASIIIRSVRAYAYGMGACPDRQKVLLALCEEAAGAVMHESPKTAAIARALWAAEAVHQDWFRSPLQNASMNRKHVLAVGALAAALRGMEFISSHGGRGVAVVDAMLLSVSNLATDALILNP